MKLKSDIVKNNQYLKKSQNITPILTPFCYSNGSFPKLVKNFFNSKKAKWANFKCDASPYLFHKRTSNVSRKCCSMLFLDDIPSIDQYFFFVFPFTIRFRYTLIFYFPNTAINNFFF